MKKLALVYDLVYPFTIGGGEKRFYDVGKMLKERNYDVHFCGMKLWEGGKVKEIDGMIYHGLCKNTSLYENGKRTIREAIRFGLSCFHLLRENFDVIDCCSFPYFSLFPAKLACMIRRRPLYSTWLEVWGKEYWESYMGQKGILGYWIERLASKLPDKVIAISESTKARLIQQLKVHEDKIIAIPNGIDIKAIDRVTPSTEKSDIIFAGRLLSHKNVNVLIKAAGLLRNRTLIVVGDGPEAENLKSLTRQLNLQKNVIFKGFAKDNKEVFALMKSSKVFVLPSEREGFGITVIEANACGIPVITIDHKDNASKDLIIPGKNGYLTDLNEEGIAAGIVRALNRQDWKAECRQYVGKYAWENIISQFEVVYEGK